MAGMIFLVSCFLFSGGAGEGEKHGFRSLQVTLLDDILNQYAARTKKCEGQLRTNFYKESQFPFIKIPLIGICLVVSRATDYQLVIKE